MSEPVLKTKTVYSDDGTPYLTQIPFALGDIVRSTSEKLDYVGVIVDLMPQNDRYIQVEWQKWNIPSENRQMTFTEHLDGIEKWSYRHGTLGPPAYKAFVERRAAEVREQG